MSPSGEQFVLRAAGYRATVTEVGAALRTLTHDGRALVRNFAEDEVRPVYSGAVLAPWPNRIADGRYPHGETVLQLPLTEPERATALHGLVCWAAWRPVGHSRSSLKLEHTLWPTPGYPFRLRLVTTYERTEAGLTVSVSAENTLTGVAPYGCSIHPYLVGGAGRVNDWTLRLPASRVLDVDPHRLLPTGQREVAGSPFDFRDGHPIGPLKVDHAFGGVEFGAGTTAEAVVLAADGHGVRLRWDSMCPWVQVHTADRPEPVLDRTGLAVEPMTCPPDAFNSGRDVVRLAPGATHVVRWRLAAV
ncbi:galactose mutarotase [Saccharomonospora piscinae]|uniref:Galactose mutarotase n=1 Tax=Saccharomonospora piscinae TaxID=687388 RepID=A0A1V9A9T1_SACPI|nr:aldose 1-epimerase family protein [Saccharomonospora piscinae]OQO93831.1 galactose mutarotase [Saccharomonospora piscinae]